MIILKTKENEYYINLFLIGRKIKELMLGTSILWLPLLASGLVNYLTSIL